MSEQALERYRELVGPAAHPRVRATRGLSWWAMALVIATEAALFAVLIAAYFYLRWQTDGSWPPGGIPDPKLLRPTFIEGSAVLAVLPMAGAYLAIKRGSQVGLRVGLALVIALGLTFLGLQAWDFAEKVKEFTPQTNAYASFVYLLLGMHAVHVVVGVIFAIWVWVRALGGAYTAESHLAIRVVAMYQYFLAVLAIAVYFTVVISPHL